MRIFFCTSVFALQRMYKISISRCSDFILVLRGHGGTRSGHVSQSFWGDFFSSQLSNTCLFSILYLQSQKATLFI